MYLTIIVVSFNTQHTQHSTAQHSTALLHITNTESLHTQHPHTQYPHITHTHSLHTQHPHITHTHTITKHTTPTQNTHNTQQCTALTPVSPHPAHIVWGKTQKVNRITALNHHLIYGNCNRFRDIVAELYCCIISLLFLLSQFS